MVDHLVGANRHGKKMSERLPVNELDKLVESIL